MGKYDVSFKRMVVLLLPTFLRKPTTITLGLSSAAPLGRLHNDFLAYKKTTDYRLYHNGQVCYLTAVLNDSFDPISRRIQIAGKEEREWKIIYCRAIGRWMFLPKRESSTAIVINKRGFSGATSADFVIEIPRPLRGLDEDRLKAIVNSYKLASKRYIINYV